MGMFSYIFCKAPLPLNEELKSLDIKWDEVEFQTKDLDNCLEKYIITEDGKLIEEITKYEYTYYTEEEKKRKDHRSWDLVKDQKIINQYTKDVNFHGIISFYEIFEYSELEDIWIDFEVYFTHGKLDKIKLVNTKKYESNKIKTKKFFEEHDKKTKSLSYKVKKYFGWFFLWRKVHGIIIKIINVLHKLQTFCIKRLNLVIVFLLLNSNILVAQKLNFSGNIDYIQQKNKNLYSNNNLEYKFNLFENHKYSINLSNSLNVDLDCFNNQIKETNVFTTLQIEF